MRKIIELDKIVMAFPGEDTAAVAANYGGVVVSSRFDSAFRIKFKELSMKGISIECVLINFCFSMP